MQQRTAWHESVPPPNINASSTAVSSLALHQAAPYRLVAWSSPVVRPRRRTLPADGGCCRQRMHSPQRALLTLLHGRMRVRKSLESPRHTRARGINSHVCVDAQAVHSLHVGGGAAVQHSPSERASMAGGATTTTDDDCWRDSADPTWRLCSPRPVSERYAYDTATATNADASHGHSHGRRRAMPEYTVSPASSWTQEYRQQRAL